MMDNDERLIRKLMAAEESLDEALAKAMLRADPSLKPDLVHTYLAASHQKGSGVSRKKEK